MSHRWLVVLALSVSCQPRAAENRASNGASPTTSVAAHAAADTPPALAPSASTAASELAVPPTPPAPSISVERAETLLFAGPAPAAVALACPTSLAPAARVQCLIGERYKDDPAAQKLAKELHASYGYVPGVYPKEVIDGGYRGIITLVPELPIGKYRNLIDWMHSNTKDFDATFGGIAKAAPNGTIHFRWQALALAFYRSVDKTTPNGFTIDWGYAVNVVGSLMKSDVALREIMVHEITHLNDFDHGGWSAKALGPTYDAIVKKCGTNIACLKPYAPTDVVVKNGTYYAFQPGNTGVGEYAGELAARYYEEQRAMLRNEPLKKPAFKCGPKENAVTWTALAKEFFAGVDLVPACKT